MIIFCSTISNHGCLMPFLSLPHLTLLDASPPEVVRAAAAAGFDGVGLRIFPTMAGERQHPLIGDTPMLRETQGLLAETGLKVIDIEAIWLRPETVPEDYVGGFEAASKLGARVIQAIGDDADEQRLADTYARLCALAAPFDLTVDLEYLAGAMTNSLAKAMHVVNAARPPNGGLLVDCLHINRCGTDPDDLLRVDASLIHVFQLCDGDAEAPVGRDALNHEARFGRRLPGEGAFDLDAIWRTIPAGAFVSVEVPLGDARGKLGFADRARILKAGADAFLARAGKAGRARSL
jgi:sugar phosphate isomerase/epimerase